MIERLIDYSIGAVAAVISLVFIWVCAWGGLYILYLIAGRLPV